MPISSPRPEYAAHGSDSRSPTRFWAGTDPWQPHTTRANKLFKKMVFVMQYCPLPDPADPHICSFLLLYFSLPLAPALAPPPLSPPISPIPPSPR